MTTGGQKADGASATSTGLGTASTTAPPPDEALRQANQTAFSRDLEFLSSLANPFYLNHLATSNVLSSPAFLRYLKHLDYFRHPKYVKYLQYPQALHLLDLLQRHQDFRLACKDTAFVNQVMTKMISHWATWRNPEEEDDDDDDEKGSQKAHEEANQANIAAVDQSIPNQEPVASTSQIS